MKRFCRNCGKEIVEGKDIYRELSRYSAEIMRYPSGTSTVGNGLPIKEYECWPECKKEAK